MGGGGIRLYSPLGIADIVEIDVGVAQGATGDSVAADADGRHGAYSVKDLKEKTLVDVGGEVADIQRRRMKGSGLPGGGRGSGGAGGGRGLGRGLLGSGHGNGNVGCLSGLGIFLVFTGE